MNPGHVETIMCHEHIRYIRHHEATQATRPPDGMPMVCLSAQRTNLVPGHTRPIGDLTGIFTGIQMELKSPVFKSHQNPMPIMPDPPRTVPKQTTILYAVPRYSAKDTMLLQSKSNAFALRKNTGSAAAQGQSKMQKT